MNLYETIFSTEREIMEDDLEVARTIENSFVPIAGSTRLACHYTTCSAC